jgi:hypothetical protein
MGLEFPEFRGHTLKGIVIRCKTLREFREFVGAPPGFVVVLHGFVGALDCNAPMVVGYHQNSVNVNYPGNRVDSLWCCMNL